MVCCVCLVGLLCPSVLSGAEVVVITVDTVLDSSNTPIDGDIEVRDGGGGSPMVEVIDGVDLYQLNGFDFSVVDIFGGFVGSGVGVNDDATVNVHLLENDDDFVTVDRGVLNIFGLSSPIGGGYVARDDSRMNIFGGEIREGALIRASDNSTVHFFGRNLALFPDGSVTGTLVDGSEINIRTLGSVFVHEVPEPSTALLVGLGILGMSCRR